jgi:hypothetical protein
MHVSHAESLKDALAGVPRQPGPFHVTIIFFLISTIIVAYRFLYKKWQTGVFYCIFFYIVYFSFSVEHQLLIGLI